MSATTTDETAGDRGERCTILVVEDDRDIRETLVEVLEDEGCRLLAAANGIEALTLLRGQARAQAPTPCLILLDLMMPIMDGFGFRAEQQSDPKLRDIPVIVITAYKDADESARGLDAAGLLKKPIQLDKLLAVVGKACMHAPAGE